ncbi:unnamed protein product [Notodromas monacha]|uniref:Uncharacterized protein n=1 Tax=Notodromas monacha TaxID=399045 RepID=A0A7R9GHU2_9CRUS|nr:unnamed protein product [Notodromas monacha]CAG0921705.1 unnamed protein product [Notodromas monacha]
MLSHVKEEEMGEKAVTFEKPAEREVKREKCPPRAKLHQKADKCRELEEVSKQSLRPEMYEVKMRKKRGRNPGLGSKYCETDQGVEKSPSSAASKSSMIRTLVSENKEATSDAPAAYHENSFARTTSENEKHAIEEEKENKKQLSENEEPTNIDRDDVGKLSVANQTSRGQLTDINNTTDAGPQFSCASQTSNPHLVVGLARQPSSSSVVAAAPPAPDSAVDAHSINNNNKGHLVLGFTQAVARRALSALLPISSKLHQHRSNNNKDRRQTCPSGVDDEGSSSRGRNDVKNNNNNNARDDNKNKKDDAGGGGVLIATPTHPKQHHQLASAVPSLAPPPHGPDPAAAAAIAATGADTHHHQLQHEHDFFSFHLHQLHHRQQQHEDCMTTLLTSTEPRHDNAAHQRQQQEASPYFWHERKQQQQQRPWKHPVRSTFAKLRRSLRSFSAAASGRRGVVVVRKRTRDEPDLMMMSPTARFDEADEHLLLETAHHHQRRRRARKTRSQRNSLSSYLGRTKAALLAPSGSSSCSLEVAPAGRRRSCPLRNHDDDISSTRALFLCSKGQQVSKSCADYFQQQQQSSPAIADNQHSSLTVFRYFRGTRGRDANEVSVVGSTSHAFLSPHRQHQHQHQQKLGLVSCNLHHQDQQYLQQYSLSSKSNSQLWVTERKSSIAMMESHHLHRRSVQQHHHQQGPYRAADLRRRSMLDNNEQQHQPTTASSTTGSRSNKARPLFTTITSTTNTTKGNHLVGGKEDHQPHSLCISSSGMSKEPLALLHDPERRASFSLLLETYLKKSGRKNSNDDNKTTPNAADRSTDSKSYSDGGCSLNAAKARVMDEPKTATTTTTTTRRTKATAEDAMMMLASHDRRHFWLEKDREQVMSFSQARKLNGRHHQAQSPTTRAALVPTLKALGAVMVKDRSRSGSRSTDHSTKNLSKAQSPAALVISSRKASAARVVERMLQQRVMRVQEQDDDASQEEGKVHVSRDRSGAAAAADDHHQQLRSNRMKKLSSASNNGGCSAAGGGQGHSTTTTNCTSSRVASEVRRHWRDTVEQSVLGRPRRGRQSSQDSTTNSDELRMEYIMVADRLQVSQQTSSTSSNNPLGIPSTSNSSSSTATSSGSSSSSNNTTTAMTMISSHTDKDEDQHSMLRAAGDASITNTNTNSTSSSQQVVVAGDGGVRVAIPADSGDSHRCEEAASNTDHNKENVEKEQDDANSNVPKERRQAGRKHNKRRMLLLKTKRVARNAAPTPDTVTITSSAGSTSTAAGSVGRAKSDSLLAVHKKRLLSKNPRAATSTVIANNTIRLKAAAEDDEEEATTAGRQSSKMADLRLAEGELLALEHKLKNSLKECVEIRKDLSPRAVDHTAIAFTHLPIVVDLLDIGDFLLDSILSRPDDDDDAGGGGDDGAPGHHNRWLSQDSVTRAMIKTLDAICFVLQQATLRPLLLLIHWLQRVFESVKDSQVAARLLDWKRKLLEGAYAVVCRGAAGWHELKCASVEAAQGLGRASADISRRLHKAGLLPPPPSSPTSSSSATRHHDDEEDDAAISKRINSFKENMMRMLQPILEDEDEDGHILGHRDDDDLYPDSLESAFTINNKSRDEKRSSINNSRHLLTEDGFTPTAVQVPAAAAAVGIIARGGGEDDARMNAVTLAAAAAASSSLSSTAATRSSSKTSPMTMSKASFAYRVCAAADEETTTMRGVIMMSSPSSSSVLVTPSG